MGWRWTGMVVLAWAACTAPAQCTGTPFASAGTLRTWCQGQGTVRASCAGYLAGVVDTLVELRETGAPGPGPCLPPRLAGEQVRLLFLDHMHRNPERAGRDAPGEVRRALAEAFPCPDRPPPGAPGADRISRAWPPAGGGPECVGDAPAPACRRRTHGIT